MRIATAVVPGSRSSGKVSRRQRPVFLSRHVWGPGSMVSWFEGPVRLAQDLRAKKQTRTFCRCQLSGTWQPDQWPDGIRVEGRAGVGKPY
ncbi:hypothetical protein EV126DRAFT_420649, partial [Verticillium dahliae]